MDSMHNLEREGRYKKLGEKEHICFGILVYKQMESTSNNSFFILFVFMILTLGHFTTKVSAWQLFLEDSTRKTVCQHLPAIYIL